MILSKRTYCLSLAFAAAATVTVPLSAREALEPAAVQAQDAENSLVGAWVTRIRPRNCQTGEILPVPPAFAKAFALATFNRGGTMSEYGIGPNQTPATRSPGHGVWQREHGWNHYSYSFLFARYDATGQFAGSTRVRAALSLDAGDDAFTANSAVEVLDADGNVTGTMCTTATGTRFE